MNFNRFLSKIKHFEVVKTHAKRSNKLCKLEFDNLFHLPYWELKHTIPEYLKQGELEKALFLILRSKKKNITFETVRKSSNYKKAKFLFWVFDEYKRINELEKTQLKSDPDPDALRAGVDKLNVLEDFNLIDNIAKNYNYTHKQVKNLEYDLVFSIQLKQKIEREINKKYLEIRRKKKK